jgi:hypothetical protein
VNVALSEVTVLLLSGTALFYPFRAILMQNSIIENKALRKVVPGNVAARIPGSKPGEPSPEFCLVLLAARSNGGVMSLGVVLE